MSFQAARAVAMAIGGLSQLAAAVRCQTTGQRESTDTVPPLQELTAT